MLTKVKRVFRALKTGIRIRPIYHQKDERIEGHIFLSVLAYHILHTIEWFLKMEKDGRSWETIKEELIPHQMVEVVIPDDRGKVLYIKLLTEPTEEQKEIYEKLKINARPLRARHIIVGEM